MNEDKKPYMRTMTTGDIPEIIEIEKRSFISPWTRGMFVQTLASPVSHSFVMIDGQRISGYIIFYQAGLEIHIMNIAVHPDHRRQGIGGAMMAENTRISPDRFGRDMFPGGPGNQFPRTGPL